MFKLFVAIICCAIFIKISTAGVVDVNNTVYFYKDWCPLESQRVELSKHFVLTMNECCIAKAEYINPIEIAAQVALQPYTSYISADQDISWCRGENEEQKIKAKKDNNEFESNRKKAAAIELVELPSILRRLDISTLCVEAGKLLREEAWFVIAPNMQAAALPFVKAEIKRRYSSISVKRTKNSQILRGDSECQLYASWGLPVSKNNMTGSDYYIQHVYSGARNYVYTRDGVITS